MTLSNSQIDKLGDRLRDGELDADCLRRLDEFRALFEPSYQQVETILVNRLGLKITGRPAKSTVAIIEKLRRETIRLNQIQDIAGCRVVVDGLITQDRFVETMKVMLGDVRVEDKRSAPKHGYRAVHLIASPYGRPVEIQLRTMLQDTWANLSEKVADDFGHAIKYGQGDPLALDFLAKLSQETAVLENIRRDRALHVQQVRARGKTKDAYRKTKALNSQERDCLRRIRSIFSGK